MAWKFRGEVPYTWYCNLMLMLCYAVGELGHFLLGVTSKPMAQSIHFGDEGCMPTNETFTIYHSTCTESSKNQTSCEVIEQNGTVVCKWDYTGSGVEYQLLAGPCFVAIFTIMGIVLGVLGDKYNRVRILFCCIFLCSIFILLMGFSREYWQLALLRFGFGAAEAGFSPLSASIIADTFSQASRGLAMSVFNWGIYFGFGSAFAVGNLVTQADINGQGWRWAYFISGIPGFIFAVLILLSIKEPARREIDTAATSSSSSLKEKRARQRENADSEAQFLSQKILISLKIFISTPYLLVLLLAACIRHSASFCFAYNSQLYFNHFYPETNLGLWMTLSSIIGGSIGIASGGLISDLVVSKYGVKTRLWVLVVSQAMAAPLAVGVLYLPPPYCFFSLIGAYLFAEMWFGILFAVLVELLPMHVRSTSLAMFFFVINNVAGGVLLFVPLLKDAIGFRPALTLVYPGFYLGSSVFFYIAQFILKQKSSQSSKVEHEEKEKNDEEDAILSQS